MAKKRKAKAISVKRASAAKPAAKPAPAAPRPMSPQGPAVVPLAPRSSPFPSASPAGGAYGTKDSDKND